MQTCYFIWILSRLGPSEHPIHAGLHALAFDSIFQTSSLMMPLAGSHVSDDGIGMHRDHLTTFQASAVDTQKKSYP